MVDVYVLNENLKAVGIVDYYTSLIWAKRYNEVGDCELYVQATPEAILILRNGYYLARDDDDMLCRIKKIEIQTDVENGNYLVVTGYDVKDILNQRIVWSQTNVDTTVESYIRKLVQDSLINPSIISRKIPRLRLDTAKGFSERITEQVTHSNVGEKVQELCKKYNWGYRVRLHGDFLRFGLYKGEDKSDYVVFSPEYENLMSSKYTEDSVNKGNVALIGGTGEGSSRTLGVAGSASGINRYEVFIDAKSTSKTITYLELITMYPLEKDGGQGYIYKTGSNVSTYRMRYVDIPILDEQHKMDLLKEYPDGTIIQDGAYYRIENAIIADMESYEPADTDNVTLRDLVYNVYLINKGYETLATYGTKVSFEGSVEPNVTFKYKEDYSLGDIVTVENEYGIGAEARIVEVIETFDENGYSVEPKFEYIDVSQVDYDSYLLAESGEVLTTEDGVRLKIEEAQSETVEAGSGVKISELPEADDLNEGSCLPVVSWGKTKKVTYGTLKEKLSGELTCDYNKLNNKPKINAVELIDNKSFDDLGLKALDEIDILAAIERAEENNN